MRLESGDGMAAATVFELMQEAEPKAKATAKSKNIKKIKKTPLSPISKGKIVRKKIKISAKKSKPIFKKKAITGKNQPKFSRREIK
jgi:hypothetical protein